MKRRRIRLPAFARQRPATALIGGTLVALNVFALGNLLFLQNGRSRVPGLDGPALIRAVQLELGARGYYQGRADGRAGPRTAAAIRSFQRATGLHETGQIDMELFDRIRTSAPPVR